MRKIFVLSLLLPCALICSCQKQDATAEQQLAQRKAELDAREKALDEREKALSARESLAMKPRFPAVPRVAPGEPQRTVPPELKGLIADPSNPRADRAQRMQERLAERQRRLEEIQKMRAARGLPHSEGTASAIEATPATEAASPIPSPTPE
jgi:DNA repair exonuclease SbcCD ATPase subunit